MSTPRMHDNEAEMLAAEHDVRSRLAGRPLDFDAMRVISNIYRSAAAVRRKAEQGELAQHGLTWGGFTILFVLWVWGEMPTSELATECDLAKGTLTGMLTTLSKRDLVSRTQSAADKRRVLVGLTESGTEVIEELFPAMNGFMVDMADGLSTTEQHQLAELLRKVIINAS